MELRSLQIATLVHGKALEHKTDRTKALNAWLFTGACSQLDQLAEESLQAYAGSRFPALLHAGLELTGGGSADDFNVAAQENIPPPPPLLSETFAQTTAQLPPGQATSPACSAASRPRANTVRAKSPERSPAWFMLVEVRQAFHTFQRETKATERRNIKLYHAKLPDLAKLDRELDSYERMGYHPIVGLLAVTDLVGKSAITTLENKPLRDVFGVKLSALYQFLRTKAWKHLKNEFAFNMELCAFSDVVDI